MQDSTIFAHRGGLTHSLTPLPGHDHSAGTLSAGPFPPYGLPQADSRYHHRDAPMSDMHVPQMASTTTSSAEVNLSQRRDASGSSHRTSNSNTKSPATVNKAARRSSVKQGPGSAPSACSSSSATAPAPKTGQKRKAKARETATKDSGDENSPKRNKFLERNRLAASKCREKKKVWLHELEETKEELEERHRGLRMEYESLMEEVTRMKNSIVSHARCSDPKIDSWIKSEAHRFVKRSAQRPPSPCFSTCSRTLISREGSGFYYSNSPASEESKTDRKMSINFDHMSDDASD